MDLPSQDLSQIPVSAIVVLEESVYNNMKKYITIYSNQLDRKHENKSIVKT